MYSKNGATAVWQLNPKGLAAGDSRPEGARKCNMEKPCATGAGIKWDAAALGVKKAETRKFLGKK